MVGAVWPWGFLKEAGGVGGTRAGLSEEGSCALLPAVGRGRAGDVRACLVLSQRKSMPGPGPVFKGNE